MPAQIIDGAAHAAVLREQVGAEVRRLQSTAHITPGLAVVLVGSNPASQVYVKSKSQLASAAGIIPVDHHLPEQAREQKLLALIDRLNDDAAVHSILVQLPLPPHIQAAKVLQAIDPTKDVDGFHPINVGLLATGQQEHAFIPCTPLGCLMLLKKQLGNLAGLSAVVIGRSNIVGKPMAQLLVNESCTVTIAHSRTKEIEAHCRAADILVAAVGKPHFVRGNWIKPGACVIDVGINRVTGADGKSRLVGDVAFDEVAEVAGAITPVPGGVGPMTIACLLANTTTSAFRHAHLPAPQWF
ncbi:MAG: bifunctional 5,10-methylenetetrahydrofolate dehydrogenase/5,10-methenyltetrahydrofolate cyclohydrolase [Hyphomicrobiaceae bacterium]